MTRFGAKAAWIVGIALPVLETIRRRTNFHPLYSYVDDFIAGGLLLCAASMAHRRRRQANGMLCAAWGILTGGLYYSFFGQIERSPAVDISGIRNIYVILIKGLLFATATAALISSVRASSSETGTDTRGANKPFTSE